MAERLAGEIYTAEVLSAIEGFGKTFTTPFAPNDVRYSTIRFGVFGYFFLLLPFFDHSTLREMHLNINLWTDGEINEWKQSQMNIFNSIAVAGAIFATLGLTTLQIPDMFTIHWSARAFCISSMIVGILSVTTATSLYQKMAQQRDALSIRLWLSCGRLESLTSRKTRIHRKPNYAKLPPYSILPLESSISSLKLIQLPQHLLTFAVFLFIVGFGLYALFLWLENLDKKSVAHRNVFIFTLITLGLLLSYYWMVFRFNATNEDRKFRSFGLENSWDGLIPDKIKTLQRELANCQTIMTLTRSHDERIAKLMEDAKGNINEANNPVPVSPRRQSITDKNGAEQPSAGYSGANGKTEEGIV